MDYNKIELDASKRASLMVKNYFNGLLEKKLPFFIESVINSILEEKSFETVKKKPFLTKNSLF